MEKNQTVKPGVYDGISNAEYHGGPGISKSGLDLLARSPMHLKWAMGTANGNPPTAAQKIGTAAHALILEPEVFTQEYAVAPQVDRRTKAGKEAWASFQAENEGRELLTQDEWDQLHAMRDAVMAHPVASKLLTGAPGKAEQSVYWQDQVTGELCRCRPDFWRQDGILVDLKSTDDAGLESFSKSLANWRYHVQHPFYLDGCCHAIEQAGLDLVKPNHFLFLVVEKRAPYGVAVYQLDQESIDLGREQYRRDLDLYHQCRQTDEWPGYGNRIQQIGVPQWYLLRQVGGVK